MSSTHLYTLHTDVSLYIYTHAHTYRDSFQTHTVSGHSLNLHACMDEADQAAQPTLLPLRVKAAMDFIPVGFVWFCLEVYPRGNLMEKLDGENDD